MLSIIANRGRTKALGVALSAVFQTEPTMLEVGSTMTIHSNSYFVAASELERMEQETGEQNDRGCGRRASARSVPASFCD